MLTHWKGLWCWEGLGAGGKGDDRGWYGWMASLTRWTDVSLSELWEMVMDREGWCAVIHGVAKSRTWLSDWTELKALGDTKGRFHAKVGTIKGRNVMDLTEAQDIKKRWQEYTKELYKKDLHNSDNHDGVITHLEPDILVHEVKWKHHYKQN